MAVSRPKRPRDANQLAWQIVQEATGQRPRQATVARPVARQAAAAALGGQARAKALGPKQRRLIAKAAAAARWTKKK